MSVTIFGSDELQRSTSTMIVPHVTGEKMKYLVQNCILTSSNLLESKNGASQCYESTDDTLRKHIVIP